MKVKDEQILKMIVSGTLPAVDITLRLTCRELKIANSHANTTEVADSL